MSAAVAADPRIIHAISGRVRVHVPGSDTYEPRVLQQRLRAMPGVRRVQVSALTANVLISFDPAETDHQAILAQIHAMDGPPRDEENDTASGLAEAPPVALRERVAPGRLRARIAVRGLDREPALGRRVVEHLQRQPGVIRAVANPLTARVLVEYHEHHTEIEDLIAEVTNLELPALPGEDRPSHPLDPAPLLQSATRVLGAGLGLGLLALRTLVGAREAPVTTAAPVITSAVIGIVQGFPATRNGLRALLGRHVADLSFQGTAIVSLALSGNPLGLAVNGLEALRLLTEVLARRSAWRRHEDRLGHEVGAQPGMEIRCESGDQAPMPAVILEGSGTATGRDGLPAPLFPGARVPAGARLRGGPFVLELQSTKPFLPEPRPAPPSPSLYDRYIRGVGIASLAYAALTALLTRSLSRTFASLLLVNPRPAVIGAEASDLGAAARVLRANVTVVGTRHDRPLRLPDLLVLDGPRVLCDGFEVESMLGLADEYETADIMALAAGVAAAAGSPWGGAFSLAGALPALDGTFHDAVAQASIRGARYRLGVATGEALSWLPRAPQPGTSLLALRSEDESRPLGFFVLRPRLAPGLADLVETCRRHGVGIGLLSATNAAAAQLVARRAGVSFLDEHDAVAAVRARQARGALVALVSDSVQAGAAFAACDLAIGLTAERTHRFPARADLLAPDLNAVAAIIEAGGRRKAAVRDAVLLSAAANGIGAVWGLRGAPGLARASQVVYVSALAALVTSWARLRGGERPRAFLAGLVDPRPERWGRRGIPSVLEAFTTTAEGLTSAQAAARRQAQAPLAHRGGVARALLNQLQSPLTAILATGAGISLVLGAAADVAIIGVSIGVNAAVGVWLEHRAGQEAATLERLSTPTGMVLRDGESLVVPAGEIVPGDVLLLAPGQRAAADARLIAARGLEVDEASLTGESLPTPKAPSGGSEASRVILAGSDVTVGTGRAVVVAVGEGTRLGATAAALAMDETEQSPLGIRLSQMLRQILPLIGAGGAIVLGSGLLRRRPVLPQLAIAASIAVAAVPEGLPLLAGVGEAAVARRLAGRNVIVRRLSAVEALGRVDIACTDKTGTLTQGRLALSVVMTMARPIARTPAADLPADARHVLLTGGLATPHPNAVGASAHPTDVAVTQGALVAGLEVALQATRDAEAPFDPTRPFHAAIVDGRLCVKGAVEVLAPRCAWVRRDEGDQALNEESRSGILEQAERLAGQGYRVLMVAERAPGGRVDDPRDLVALGFLGISDPLRPGVAEAVRRCREAGVRVIMLTGDHPATAKAIGLQAGLLGGGATLLTGADIAELEHDQLDARLERVAVIARVTPLDKLRIVESLQRQGHTVAMTGDGVNDAPALRLADVGVAMGRGTEVARQAADMVLADDDFSTLVEALVEGRSFWRNIRRALGLLLGGNLGELGLMVGAGVLGLVSPLNTRQILAVNLVTDALPSLAVALQQPEHRHLATLAREGTSALGTPLRDEVLRRGGATALPALGAYLAMLRTRGLGEARAVAFASIVATQLAQTLDAGRAEGGLSRSVFAAVGGSAGLLLAALTLPPLKAFLQLSTPGALGWLLIGGASLTAVLLGGASRLATPGTRPGLSLVRA